MADLGQQVLLLFLERLDFVSNALVSTILPQEENPGQVHSFPCFKDTNHGVPSTLFPSSMTGLHSTATQQEQRHLADSF